MQRATSPQSATPSHSQTPRSSTYSPGIDLISANSSPTNGELRSKNRRVSFQTGTKEHSERSRPVSRSKLPHDDSSSFENEQTVRLNDASESVPNSDEEAKVVPQQEVMREHLQEISNLNQAIRAASIHCTQEYLVCATCNCDMEPGHSYFKCASCEASSHTTCMLNQTKCRSCNEPMLGQVKGIDADSNLKSASKLGMGGKSVSIADIRSAKAAAKLVARQTKIDAKKVAQLQTLKANQDKQAKKELEAIGRQAAKAKRDLELQTKRKRQQVHVEKPPKLPRTHGASQLELDDETMAEFNRSFSTAEYIFGLQKLELRWMGRRNSSLFEAIKDQLYMQDPEKQALWWIRTGLGDFLMKMDATDAFYRELLLSPRATSLDPYIKSCYHGSKPQLLDVVALADLYKRCIEVYDEKGSLLLAVGRLWSDRQKILLCYWKDSGYFDSIKSQNWLCDNELDPGKMESKAFDSFKDSDAQRFRHEVFKLNPTQPIPAVDYIPDTRSDHPDCSQIVTEHQKTRAALSKNYLLSDAITTALKNRLYQLTGKSSTKAQPSMKKFRSVSTQYSPPDKGIMDSPVRMNTTQLISQAKYQHSSTEQRFWSTAQSNHIFATPTQKTRDEVPGEAIFGFQSRERQEATICSSEQTSDADYLMSTSQDPLPIESIFTRAKQVCSVFYSPSGNHEQEGGSKADKIAMMQLVHDELIECTQKKTKGPSWLGHMKLYAIGSTYRCQKCGRYFSSWTNRGKHRCNETRFRHSFVNLTTRATRRCIMCGTRLPNQTQDLLAHLEKHSYATKFLFGLATSPRDQ